MSSSPDPHEQQIIRSWHTNAEPWSDAIRTRSIASRRLATDQAIIEAVMESAPERVLDIGCGEGWLARKLLERNIAVVGVDAIPALIARAAAGGPQRGGEFHVLDYASLARRELRCEPCDTAVCNFSLLGSDSVEAVLAALPGYLRGRGRLVVQTLHPRTACGAAAYEDGWREGNWQGFGPDFKDPAPWYFRTLESWQRMLRRCGFLLSETREPKLPGSSEPVSVLFICDSPEVTT
jgi:2-polyprenyl-3-methyl-5-hydroxy-6-metoxy-1,4-benzoquinol methylase